MNPLVNHLFGYDTPKETFTSPTIKYFVALMDRYRELRLFWHFVDFFIVLGLVLVVILIALKVRRIHQEMQARQTELSHLVANTNKTTKDASKVYSQINAIESHPTPTNYDKDFDLLPKQGRV